MTHGEPKGAYTMDKKELSIECQMIRENMEAAAEMAQAGADLACSGGLAMIKINKICKKSLGKWRV